MNEITVTLPAIDESVIANLEKTSTETAATEADALAAIRTRYAPLARQNGFVRIGWSYSGDGSNWSKEVDYHFRRDGKKVKALLCVDAFDRTHSDQNHGRQVGTRLYLLESGEWLQIKRDGVWSAWQGASEWWECGEGILPCDDPGAYDESDSGCGWVKVLADAEVVAAYRLDKVVAGLGGTLKTLTQKLPERMSAIRRRADLAQKLLDALES